MRRVAREPEFWLLEDFVTIGGTCDVRARGGGSSIPIVFWLMNFRF
jgi:hypothetical protein